MPDINHESQFEDGGDYPFETQYSDAWGVLAGEVVFDEPINRLTAPDLISMLHEVNAADIAEGKHRA